MALRLRKAAAAAAGRAAGAGSTAATATSTAVLSATGPSAVPFPLSLLMAGGALQGAPAPAGAVLGTGSQPAFLAFQTAAGPVLIPMAAAAGLGGTHADSSAVVAMAMAALQSAATATATASHSTSTTAAVAQFNSSASQPSTTAAALRQVSTDTAADEDEKLSGEADKNTSTNTRGGKKRARKPSRTKQPEEEVEDLTDRATSARNKSGRGITGSQCTANDTRGGVRTPSKDHPEQKDSDGSDSVSRVLGSAAPHSAGSTPHSDIAIWRDSHIRRRHLRAARRLNSPPSEAEHGTETANDAAAETAKQPCTTGATSTSTSTAATATVSPSAQPTLESIFGQLLSPSETQTTQGDTSAAAGMVDAHGSAVLPQVLTMAQVAALLQPGSRGMSDSTDAVQLITPDADNAQVSADDERSIQGEGDVKTEGGSLLPQRIDSLAGALHEDAAAFMRADSPGSQLSDSEDERGRQELGGVLSPPTPLKLSKHPPRNHKARPRAKHSEATQAALVSMIGTLTGGTTGALSGKDAADSTKAAAASLATLFGGDTGAASPVLLMSMGSDSSGNALAPRVVSLAEALGGKLEHGRHSLRLPGSSRSVFIRGVKSPPLHPLDAGAGSALSSAGESASSAQEASFPANSNPFLSPPGPTTAAHHATSAVASARTRSRIDPSAPSSGTHKSARKGTPSKGGLKTSRAPPVSPSAFLSPGGSTARRMRQVQSAIELASAMNSREHAATASATAGSSGLEHDSLQSVHEDAVHSGLKTPPPHRDNSDKSTPPPRRRSRSKNTSTWSRDMPSSLGEAGQAVVPPSPDSTPPHRFSQGGGTVTPQRALLGAFAGMTPSLAVPTCLPLAPGTEERSDSSALGHFGGGMQWGLDLLASPVLGGGRQPPPRPARPGRPGSREIAVGSREHGTPASGPSPPLVRRQLSMRGGRAASALEPSPKHVVAVRTPERGQHVPPTSCTVSPPSLTVAGRPSRRRRLNDTSATATATSSASGVPSTAVCAMHCNMAPSPGDSHPPASRHNASRLGVKRTTDSTAAGSAGQATPGGMLGSLTPGTHLLFSLRSLTSSQSGQALQMDSNGRRPSGNSGEAATSKSEKRARISEDDQDSTRNSSKPKQARRQGTLLGSPMVPLEDEDEHSGASTGTGERSEHGSPRGISRPGSRLFATPLHRPWEPPLTMEGNGASMAAAMQAVYAAEDAVSSCAYVLDGTQMDHPRAMTNALFNQNRHQEALGSAAADETPVHPTHGGGDGGGRRAQPEGGTAAPINFTSLTASQ